jgi:16S rRNA processing protein RimM
VNGAAAGQPGDALLEIGHIGRAHGLRGEVVVHLVSNRDERVAPGAVLVTARGQLTVRSTRANNAQRLVAFEEIPDRTAAEAWRGVTLLGEPIVDDRELWVHELVGCDVVEVDGTRRGQVTAVVANPASDLLELASGALVPLRFLVRRDAGTLVVDVPEGLFDLTGQ